MDRGDDELEQEASRRGGGPGERRDRGDVRGPVDPDVDLSQPTQSREWTAHRWTLPTIAVGGMAGASARHGLELAWPAGLTGFPLSTFATNVSGCLLLGVLMVVVVEHGAGHPLLRPFLGVGVLGGFTTFSTYAVQGTGLVQAGVPVLALIYLFGTLAAALAAIGLGMLCARSLGWGRSR